MTEPVIGDRVSFRESGRWRSGIVTKLITAGRVGGVGPWKRRQRVRIRFEVDGYAYETHRDLTEIEVTAADLFAALTD